MKSSAQAGIAALLIILLIFIVGAISAAIIIPRILSPAPSPISQAKKQLPTPSLVAISSTLPVTSPDLSASPSPATPLVTNGPLSVIVYSRADKKAFYADIYITTISSFSTLYYNLNYDTDEVGGKRGIEGTFTPTGNTVTGYSSGQPYFRRELVLGTCSKDVCRYDSNPRNFQLTVKSTSTTGAVTTVNLTPILK